MTQPVIDPEHPYAHLAAEERLDQLEKRFHTLVLETEFLRQKSARLEHLVSRLANVARLQSEHGTELRKAVEHMADWAADMNQVLDELVPPRRKRT